MILSLPRRFRAGRDRVRRDPNVLGFDTIQLLKQLIEFGGPPQLLVLMDFWKNDSAWLRKSDDASGIETTQAGVLPAELKDYALKPILFSLPLAERM
jgi:hypothetical protein